MCATLPSEIHLQALWFVMLGSAVGGGLRWVVGGWVQARYGPSFPVGTLLVNVTGALLLGFLARYTTALPQVSGEMRAMLTAGLCGGFTTFSTFSYETVELIGRGGWSRATMYVALSVVLSLAAMGGGFAIARVILDRQESIAGSHGGPNS